jgi:hypothetical protein
MGDDELRDHVEALYAKRRRVAPVVSQTGEFGEKERPEVVKVKSDDDLETVDPATIKKGEVSRS